MKFLKIFVLFICILPQSSFAGWKLHFNGDATIYSSFDISSDHFICGTELISSVSLDPATPADTLTITSTGNLNLSNIAIATTGDVLIQVDGTVDIVGAIHSEKDVTIKTTHGDIITDANIIVRNLSLDSARNLINARRVSATPCLIPTFVPSVTMEGITRGQFKVLRVKTSSQTPSAAESTQ